MRTVPETDDVAGVKVRLRSYQRASHCCWLAVAGRAEARSWAKLAAFQAASDGATSAPPRAHSGAATRSALAHHHVPRPRAAVGHRAVEVDSAAGRRAAGQAPVPRKLTHPRGEAPAVERDEPTSAHVEDAEIDVGRAR